MSDVEEIRRRLLATNTLIARYLEALDVAESAESTALQVNLRTLNGLATRLEADFREYEIRP